MLATLVTAVVNGLRGELVRVEIDVAPGLPVCHIVGLPDAALSEARERVRGALRNSGFEYPTSRITVNLAPATLRKRGAAYDLAIGVGILVASGQIRRGGGSWALLGELSLSGAVQPVTGVLPMVATLARAGHRRIGVPRANVAEAELVKGVEIVGLDGLDDAARLVAGPRGRIAGRASRRPTLAVTGVPGGADGAAREGATTLAGGPTGVDLADVRGQRYARWALEIALSGAHNLLLVGPPGAGKTLLGRAIPGLLPPLSEAEALDVTVIESVAGLLDDAGRERRRPFRAPHHTSSYAALVGGGPWLQPGEVTLAHTGTLFLDELPEFDRTALDALRQPLEEGVVTIARVHGRIRYPARFQLVAAMNPCRCGFAGTDRECRCPALDPQRYVARISGPLMDRFDMRVEMTRVPTELLLSRRAAESSAVVGARIATARRLAVERNRGGVPNAQLSGSSAVLACMLTPDDRRELTDFARNSGLTARGMHRVLRVARSIADLDGRAAVSIHDVTAAARLREPGQPLAASAAA